MKNRISSHRHVSDRAVNLATVVAVLALGTLTVSLGCKAPGAKGEFRLPGTTSLPGIQQASKPPMTSGGRTVASPGVSQTLESPTTEAAASEPASAPSAATGGGVEQVGFVDRMRAAGNCGSCRSCVQGGAGVQCETVQPTYLPLAMGRPVDPQEFLCNGGDIPPEARVLRSDDVAGVNPQDAIVHYTTEAGDIEIVPSNRVCVYSPRFGAIRQVSGAVAGEKAVGLRGTYLPVGPTRIGLAQPSLIVEDIDELAHADVARRIDAMRDRNRGVPVEGIVQPYLAEDALQILATLDIIALNRLDESQLAILQRGAIAAQSWMVRDAVEVMIESLQPPVLIRDAAVESFVEYDFPDAGRLAIIKVADRDHAQQGEEVSFAIRVKNVGDSAVNRVEIVDNLVSRLEYVEDSQTCDREAEFETKVNSAGSSRLKWMLAEPLAVGETALIEFKCRVR
jgi:uncharacterized repeat protein (TIGR01451 family)